MAEVNENTTTQVVEPTQNVNLVNNPYINATNPAPSADATANSGVSGLLNNFDTNKFLVGLAIGAAGAYLLTNENAQKALFKTFAKGSELFTAGMEEIKERFEDAKAEMEAERS